MLRVDSHILIVDGQVAVARLVEKICGLAGFSNAGVAFDTPTARNQMEAKLPDLLILDARIAPMNVTAFVRLTRKLTHGQAVTMMMTTSKSAEVVEAAREAGVDGILLKPFTPKDLKAQLVLAVEGRKASATRISDVTQRDTVALD